MRSNNERKGGNPSKHSTAQESEQKKQEKQDGKSKPWYKNQQRINEEKKKDPEATPILKYGANNNFIKFKEAMSKAALKNNGNLGKLIMNGGI